MSENRCQCGGLRHKHDIERIAALESSLAQAQADVEALRTVIFAIIIPACEAPQLRGAKTQRQQARFLDDLRGRVLAALPKHLRGAKEQEGASLAENR